LDAIKNATAAQRIHHSSPKKSVFFNRPIEFRIRHRPACDGEDDPRGNVSAAADDIQPSTLGMVIR
jgi:hypothetical protein